METLPGVAPPEQQNTYFYIGQHETKRTVPVTTELGNQAQDAGVSFWFIFCCDRFGHFYIRSISCDEYLYRNIDLLHKLHHTVF
jgi:hypothetical protein